MLSQQYLKEFRVRALHAGFSECQAAFLCASFAAFNAAMSEEDAGGIACQHCGSHDTQMIEAEFPTGVVAPDGTRETRWERGLRCRACGATE